MAQQPVSTLDIIQQFGPHLAFASGTRLDRGVEPDRLVHTHCCFCGQQCGIQLKVKDNEVIGFEPWEEFPFNKGMLCPKGVKRYLQGSHPDRLLTALARAETFGVIAIAQRSIRRHVRYLRQMGLMDRLTRERPLNMSVAETASGEGTLAKMIEVGRALKDEDGSGAIVMGCAGMARHRRPLEQALGIPVIDPTQAAVTMALGTVQFSHH